MMLSEEILDKFLSQKLGMVDWREKLRRSSKLEFLKEFILAHQQGSYYQNVSGSSIPKCERKLPTVDEVIYYGTNLAGGSCVHLNYFIKLLLTSLGFDTFIVAMESDRWPVLRSHMANVVRLPSTEGCDGDDPSSSSLANLSINDDTRREAPVDTHELYFFDVGYVVPFLEPICLGELPFVGRACGFNYEYRFNDEKNLYERWSLGGCPVNGKFDDAETPNRLDYTFDLKPRQFDDFLECYERIWSPTSVSAYHDNIILSRVTQVKPAVESGDSKNTPSFEYAACRSMVFVQGTRDTYKETAYESYDAMLPIIQKFFPNLNPHQLNLAFSHYKQVQKDKEKAKAEAEAEAKGKNFDEKSGTS